MAVDRLPAELARGQGVREPGQGEMEMGRDPPLIRRKGDRADRVAGGQLLPDRQGGTRLEMGVDRIKSAAWRPPGWPMADPEGVAEKIRFHGYELSGGEEVNRLGRHLAGCGKKIEPFMGAAPRFFFPPPEIRRAEACSGRERPRAGAKERLAGGA